MAVVHLRTLYRAGALESEVIDKAVRDALRGCQETAEVEAELAAQRQLFEGIFGDPVSRAYPPPHATRQRVFKRILAALDMGSEVDDDLYAACVEGLVGNPGAPEAQNGDFDGHRVLELPGDHYVVLRVAAHMGGALETGSLLWSAGAALFGLCSTGALDQSLRGHVLELGAGTGVVGLGLARRGTPVTRVTLTDGQVAVVENLRHNVSSTAALATFAIPIEVQHLEWGSTDLQNLSTHDVDAVVGSDLVYDTSSLPALAALLQRLLRPAGTAGAAVLVYTRRSETTEQLLFFSLREVGLSWEVLQMSPTAWLAAENFLPLANDWHQTPEGAICILRVTATCP